MESRVSRVLQMTTPEWLVCAVLVAFAAASLSTQATASADDWSHQDTKKPTKCPTGFFNFGDSYTDTGSFVSAFPYEADIESPPYGEKFFGKPSKRFTNGRVVPDFFSLAFGKPLLTSYLQTSGFDYRYGVNFAVNGASASNDTTRVPFFLASQVAQFKRFKRTSLSVKKQYGCRNFQLYLPEESIFYDALYTITIGANDIILSIAKNKTAEEIFSAVIPESMQNWVHAFKTLYKEGARRFLVFNVPPVGCSSAVLTVFGGLGLPTDSLGCIASINQLDQTYNSVLNETITEIRTALPNATVSFFDYYNATIEIMTHPAKYGFHPNKTLIACCGTPGVGKYNFDINATCGHTNSTVCANADEYVSWDGIHFTDSFYKQIAKWAMNGNFTDVPINYIRSCGLNPFNFDNQLTYDQVYGGSCDVEYT